LLRLRLIASVLFVVVSVGVFVTLSRLTIASALTVSYTSNLASRESLVLDVYETVAAVTFFRSAAERLTLGQPTDRERLEKLLAWTHDNVRPQGAAPTRVLSDNFYDIIRRGFGYCDQAAHVFATLAHFAGYDARLLFLRRADNVSPHSVAEVHVGDSWVVGDPWLGVLWRDAEGNPIGVDRLLANASLLRSMGYESMGLNVDDFLRATVFEAFPYQSAAATFDKVVSKMRLQPIAPPPSTIALSPSAPVDTSVSTDGVPATDGLVAYDNARRAQLDGRYLDAVDAYRSLELGVIPTELSDSVDFFVGLALLRAGHTTDALKAFDEALAKSPRSDWRNSVLYYRGLAYVDLGELEKARGSFRAADIVQSQAALATLFHGD
jgi:tetratricopeptide (TPR) repeat protein